MDTMPEPTGPCEAEPQDMIDALRADLQEKKEQDSKGDQTVKKPVKKAKAKPKGKSKMKRPAAAPVPLRRPAAAAPLDPDPRRAALLSRIPVHIRNSYAKGCSRCYGRPFCTTCWARRGYT